MGRLSDQVFKQCFLKKCFFLRINFN
jgi:hypothetical protein